MTTTFLEMTDPGQLRPSRTDDPEFTVKEAVVRQWRFNRFLYGWVGADWSWTNRLDWSEARWRSYVEDERLRTFVGYKLGAPVGYYELRFQPAPAVELVYFGLTPAFIGRGYGGALLTSAIETAWAWGAGRVWAHTCSLDHPGALPNYLARGMMVYKTIPENI